MGRPFKSHILQILEIYRAVIIFYFLFFFYCSPDLHCTVGVYKLQARSMMFADAAALLFQSAERALIDVKSIRVATNEMEEILQLLTERDIEHTNNLPLRSSAYPYSPFPRRTHRSNSVNISLSVSASLSVYIILYALPQSPPTLENYFHIF